MRQLDAGEWSSILVATVGVTAAAVMLLVFLVLVLLWLHVHRAASRRRPSAHDASPGDEPHEQSGNDPVGVPSNHEAHGTLVDARISTISRVSQRASRRLRRPLWGAVAACALAGLGAELWHHAAPSRISAAALSKLSLSFEANVPTWLASSLLLGSAITAILIAQDLAQLRRRSWMFVGALFAWASLDEVAELHENLGGLFDTGGVLYFDWVISAAILMLAAALALWPWLWGLPRATRRRFFWACAVYFTGAVLMELPLGWWTERAGPDSLGYALIDWVEESLELCGAALMLLALQTHREGPDESEATANHEERRP